MTGPKKLSMILFLLCCASSCKKGELLTYRPNYILGNANDIEPAGSNIAGDSESATYHRQIALIATRVGKGQVKYCSAVLIEPQSSGQRYRLLTNHHCFAASGTDGQSIDQLLVAACSNTTAYFDFRPGNNQPEGSAGCYPGTLRSTYNGDLASFELSKAPPPGFTGAKLWEGAAYPENRLAEVLHYPDVAEFRQTVEGQAVPLPTLAITRMDCVVRGGFAPADWHLDRSLPMSVGHSCDLLQGSSGSALFDQATGQLLGINWGGITIVNTPGDPNGEEQSTKENAATAAFYVKAFLNDKIGQTDELLARQQADSAHAADASRTEAKGLRKVLACGVIEGSVAVPNNEKSLTWWFILLPILLLPLNYRMRA